MADGRYCGYCGGPLAEGYGNHQASDCVKYLSLSAGSFFKQCQEAFNEVRDAQVKLEQKLDGLGEVQNHHAEFISELRRNQDAGGNHLNDKFKAANKALLDHAAHLIRLRDGHQELARKLENIEALQQAVLGQTQRFVDQPAQEMLDESVRFISRDKYEADVLAAKREGYNRGSDDTRKRFARLIKEGLGDDYDKN